MIRRSEDFFLALRQARIATHRGDIDAAERWLKMAERYLAIARRYNELKEAEPQRNPATPRRPW